MRLKSIVGFITVSLMAFIFGYIIRGNTDAPMSIIISDEYRDAYATIHDWCEALVRNDHQQLRSMHYRGETLTLHPGQHTVGYRILTIGPPPKPEYYEDLSINIELVAWVQYQGYLPDYNYPYDNYLIMLTRDTGEWKIYDSESVDYMDSNWIYMPPH